MQLYLYTENFETNQFDLFVAGNGEEPIPVPKLARGAILAHLSKCECASEVDSHGVAVSRTGFLCQRVAFKILLEQRSPEGRTRLAFGCAETIGEVSETDVNNIISGLMSFFGDMAISVPDERLADLRKAITEATYGSPLKRVKRIFKVAVALALAWVVYRIFIK